MGSIDESSIDKLSSVSEFSRLIQSKSGSSSSDLSPQFLWLLRDFSLSLTREDGRGKITSYDYMEEALATMAGSTSAIAGRNSMRASIKSVFPTRDCFTLVRPCNDEAQLEKMHNIGQRDLRPEFTKGLSELSDLLLKKIQPKRFEGQLISGSAFASLAESFCKVINEGKVPSIHTTWQSVMAAENASAVDAALKIYEHSFGTSVSVPASPDKDLVEALDQSHAKAIDSAIHEFHQSALGGLEERRQGEQKIKSQATNRYLVIKQAKLAEAESKITDLLSAATSKLIPLLNSSPLDTARVDQELRGVLQAYAAAPGPSGSKFKKCVEFLMNTIISGLTQALNKTSISLMNASRELEVAMKESSQSKDVIRDLNHRISLLESTAASSRTQVASLQQEGERLRRELSDKVQSEGRIRSDEERSRNKVVDLERQISVLRAEESVRRSDLDRVRSELSQRSDSTTALSVELAKAQSEIRRLEEIDRDLGSTNSSLLSQVQSLTSRLMERDVTIKTLQDERIQQLARIASPPQRTLPPPPSAHPSAAPSAHPFAAPAEDAMDVDEAHEAGVVGTKRRRVAPAASPTNQAPVSNIVAPAPPNAAAASSTPQERQVEMGRRRSGPSAAGHPEPENLSKMTVQEMKAWLTDKNYEADVFELNSKKGKKPEWISMIKSKCT